MPAKFEIKKSKNEKFYFNLCAANGETILTSQMYASKATCMKGIRSVQVNSQEEGRFEAKKSTSGKDRFVLKAGNHQIIGTSEMYKSAAAMKSGIASVKKNGRTENIVENY